MLASHFESLGRPLDAQQQVHQDLRRLRVLHVRVGIVFGLLLEVRDAGVDVVAVEDIRISKRQKVVERAKGTVMRRLGVDEEEAYLQLKKVASTGNHKLAEVARQVLAADEVFRKLEGGAGYEEGAGFNGRLSGR